MRVFWFVLLCAIAVDFSFDVVELKQSRLTNETGDAIVHSYDVLRILHDVDVSLRKTREDQFAGRTEAEVTHVEEFLGSLRELRSLHNQIQAEPMTELAKLDSIEKSEDLITTLRERSDEIFAQIELARQEQRQILERRIQQDQRESGVARAQIITASVFDLLLLIFAAALWIFNNRRRTRDEQSLVATIDSMKLATADLKKLMSTKARKLRATVHDLKNPLGSIKGFADLIEEERNDPRSVEEMSQVLQRISIQALEMVNSLMSEEAQQESAGPVCMGECLTQACQFLAPQASAKLQKIDLEIEDLESFVFANRTQIYNVCMNLIGNALKYSPPRTKIQVRLQRDGEWANLTVEDEGPGFSLSDKQKAFGEFQTLSALPTGKEFATGLGLSICREIVAAHGGSIEIADGRIGARVIVKLPRVKRKTLSIEAGHQDPTSLDEPNL